MHVLTFPPSFAGWQKAARRALHARLQCNEERPDQRTDFQEPDLLAYVTKNRAMLVTSILTILRAYETAGSPAVDGAVWGSFEAWSARIARPLIWLGLPDPTTTHTTYEDQPDGGAARVGSLLAAWLTCFGNEGKLVADVRRLIVGEQKKETDAGDAQLLHLGDTLQALSVTKDDDNSFPSVKSISARFRSIKDSVEDGLRLVHGDEIDGTLTWKVERVAGVEVPAVPTNGVSTKPAYQDPMTELLENV